MLAEVKSCTRAISVDTLEIYLVDQHTRAMCFGNLANRLNSRFIRIRTSRIVQIGDDDQLCSWRDIALDFSRLDTKIILKAPLKAAQRSAQILRGRFQQFVSWMFDQHLVAGIERRCHRQMIRE